MAIGDKIIDLKQLRGKVGHFVSDTGNKVGEGAKVTAQKSKEAGSKAVIAMQKGAVDMSDKMKSVNYQSRMKKYNPLFPDEYYSQTFNIPNMIMIRDDAERREIDVCVGSIGWRGKVANVEVLYLYDEFVEESGLTFVPMPQCDAIYYVDPFDRKRFIRTDVICSLAHEEQIAELRSIAQKLGAKRCTIEIKEMKKETSKIAKKLSAEEKKRALLNAKESAELESEKSFYSHREGKIVAEFKGTSEVQMPTLKWFLHNNYINNLIQERLAGANMSDHDVIVISGSSTSAISQKAAHAIDGAVGGIGVKGQTSLVKQLNREENRTIYYNVEF